METKQLALPADLHAALLQYLATQPLGQVVNMFMALQQLQPVKQDASAKG